MENPRVFDRRKIRLEKVMGPDFIPFLGGRPERNGIINIDDILNLKIMLNTTATVMDFIASI